MHRMHPRPGRARPRRMFVAAAFTLAALSGLAGPASADLIRKSAERAYPDIAADINGSVSYSYETVSGSGTFHLTNSPYLLAGGPTAAEEYAVSPTSDGTRRQVLNVALDRDGKLVADQDNSYALYGTITAGGQTYSGLLLQGTPTAFGAQDLAPVGIETSDVFDVEMKITGGLLASAFGNDAYMRIMPELNSTFRGRFDEDFSADKALSNTRAYNAPLPFPSPEPTALATLLVAGGIGLFARRRRRRYFASRG